MKACLMKVNYDRKYTQPHKGYEPLQSRLHMAREVYNTGKDKKLLKESLEEAAKRKLRQHEQNRVLIQSMANSQQPDRFERMKRKSAETSQTSSTMSRLSSHPSLQRSDTPLVLSVVDQRDSPAMRSQPNTKLQPLGSTSQPDPSPKEVWKSTAESPKDKHIDLYESFLLATSQYKDSGAQDSSPPSSVLYAPRPLHSYQNYGHNRLQYQHAETRHRGNAASRKGQSVIKLKSAPGQLHSQRQPMGKRASLPERIKKAYSSSSAQNHFAAYKGAATKVPKPASATSTEVTPPRGIPDLASLDVHTTDKDDHLLDFISPRNKRLHQRKNTAEKYNDPNYIKTVSILNTPRSELALPELKPKNDHWNQKDWAALRNFQSPLKAPNYPYIHSYSQVSGKEENVKHPEYKAAGDNDYRQGRRDSLANFILSRSAGTDHTPEETDSGAFHKVLTDSDNQCKVYQESDGEYGNRSQVKVTEKVDIEDYEDFHTEPNSSREIEDYSSWSDSDGGDEENIELEKRALSSDVPKVELTEAEETRSTTEVISEDKIEDNIDDFNSPLKSTNESSSDESSSAEEIINEENYSSTENLMAKHQTVSFLEDSSNKLETLVKSARVVKEPIASVKDIEDDYFRDLFYKSDDSYDDPDPPAIPRKSSYKQVDNKTLIMQPQISLVDAKPKHRDHKTSSKKSKKHAVSEADPHHLYGSKNNKKRSMQTPVQGPNRLECEDPGVFHVENTKCEQTTKKEHKVKKSIAIVAKQKYEKQRIRLDQKAAATRKSENMLTIHDIHPKWVTEEHSKDKDYQEVKSAKEEVKEKWAQCRKHKVKQSKYLKRAARLYSKSTSDLTDANDPEKAEVVRPANKHGGKSKGEKRRLMNVGLKGSLEYESGPFDTPRKSKSSQMLKQSHFSSPSYGSDLSITHRSEVSESQGQRLTSQRYVNPYASSPTTEIQGIKRQWKKPKPRSRLFEYNTDLGYMSPLRVVQSTEDLASHMKNKSGNPYVDTHNEIMGRVSHSSARGPRRYRPKSVSEQIKNVLGIQSMSATPREFEKGKAYSEVDDPLKKLSYAHKMYARKSHSSANMLASLRAKLASRVTLSSDVGGHSYAPVPYSRSRTVVPSELMHSRIVKNAVMQEQEKRAKVEAERAMKNKKVFTIIGPYHGVRMAMRRRGWVEKFVNAPPPGDIFASSHLAMKKKAVKEANGDDDDDGTAELNVKPWEEENGYYGIMSHVVRNSTPSFVFTLKCEDVNSRVIRNGQLVNHFGKTRHITTKVGLCQSLRNSHWFDKTDSLTFYPRCYKMDEKEEKDAFIDDFRITACFGFIKHFVEKYKNLMDDNVLETNKENIEKPDSKRPESKSGKKESSNKRESSRIDSARKASASKREASRVQSARKTTTPKPDESKEKLASDSSTTSLTATQSRSRTNLEDSKNIVVVPAGGDEGMTGENQSNEPQAAPDGEVRSTSVQQKEKQTTVSVQQMPPVYTQKRLKKGGQVSGRALEVAYDQCLLFLRSKAHEDIDITNDRDVLTEGQWDQFLVWYYNFVHDGGDVKGTPNMYAECKLVLKKLAEDNPQFEMEGSKNIWILKPGAKSRGRGITLCDKMGACLQAVEKEPSMVIQKYIEKPLLIYNTKFDIRQWFVVTDWNPLTVWFYKDCYLRFCSQEFTTDDYHVSIHLSNNSLQKNFQNGSRSSQLPDDNMWTSDEFIEHLRMKGKRGLWYEKVLPGMKNAIICALLCSQEHIESRKSAFELYGADFMLGEEFDPWLIEINSSPSMARNTKATVKLVDGLLEDMCKVVLDRRTDKTSDTGGFELLYSQKFVSEPPMIDLSMCVTGRKIRKKDKR